MKREDIQYHKEFYFNTYLNYALRVVTSNGYSYSNFPFNTTYFGYIFYYNNKEISIPMKEFMGIFKDIPNLTMGSTYYEEGLPSYAKVLPDYIAHDYYNKEFSEKLIKFLQKTFGSFRNLT